MLKHLALLTMLSCAACSSPSEPKPIAQTLAQGTQITVLSQPELQQLLTAPASRPRVVNFWATWCGPCVAELPALERLAAQNPHIDVVLINTDLPSVRKTQAERFLKDRGVSSARNAAVDVPDQAKMLAEVVPNWANAIPCTLFIAKDGTVTKQFASSLNDEDLKAAISGL